jgi:hypothetical protein
VDKKITLLGSAITGLPSTSIVLPQETSSQTPFFSVPEIGVSATQNKNFASEFRFEAFAYRPTHSDSRYSYY